MIQLHCSCLCQRLTIREISDITLDIFEFDWILHKKFKAWIMQLKLTYNGRSMVIEKTSAILTWSRKASLKGVGRKINARILMTSISSGSNPKIEKIARKINSRIKMTSINSRSMVEKKKLETKINARVRMTCISSRTNYRIKKMARKINSRIRMTSINSRSMVKRKKLETKINARVRMTSINSKVLVWCSVRLSNL